MRKHAKNTLRRWLVDNHYEDIDELIEEIIYEWKTKNNKQRRNWIEVLAGNINGTERVIAGRKFPILRSAQIRLGLKVSSNAICRNEDEPSMPEVNKNNKWKNRKA